MSIAHPEVLLLLALVPLLWVLRRAVRRKLRAYRPPLLSSEVVAERASRLRAFCAKLPTACMWMATIVLIVALADPQGEVYVQEEQEKGNRFSLAFDISGSMNTKMSEETKLDAAKRSAKRLVEKNPTDPFAVLPFDISPRFQSGTPFTVDRTLIRETLDKMKAGGGTRVGTGILGAVWYVLADLHIVHELDKQDIPLPSFSSVEALIYEGGDRAGKQLAKELGREFPSREGSLIVVITDAQSGTGIPVEHAVSFAGDLGIPVYLIGIVANPSKSVQEELDKSGGGYFSADSDREIYEMYQKIDEVKPVVIQTVTVAKSDSFRTELAWVTFALFVVAFLCSYAFVKIE